MLEKSISFLRKLKENNYKEWFHENKPMYDEAKKEFEDFVFSFIHEACQIDKTIGTVEPKNCIFRIFRDVRFTNDKTPYKTNFGAYVAKGGGRKSEYAGFYVHIEPGNSMLAGGVWMPQPDVLKAIRNEIYHNVEEFTQIITAEDFKHHFGEISKEDMLKTAPKDFPKDWPNIDLLKYKSYTLGKLLSDESVNGDKFMEEIRKVFTAMLPFNNFMNRTIEDLR
jgi:uncharacterized protein (TIGR02453 family)